MAITQVDGFTNGATAAMLGCSGGATATSGGRFSGGVLSNSGNNASFSRPVTSRSKMGMHFGLNTASLGGITLFNWAEAGVTTNFTLTTSAGVWAITYGNSQASTALSSRAYAPDVGVWVGVEVWFEVSDTVGVIKLWVNGNLVINLSGIDTKNGGSGVINQVNQTMPGGGSPSISYCDWVVYDDQSPATSAPIGDIRVETLFPNGNGNSSQLAGSDGNSVNNYQLVDETPYNSDTDYVESSTVSDKDTYAFTDLSSATGSILAVQARLMAKKTDAGSRTIVPVYRSGGTEVDGASFGLNSSYSSSGQDIQETKPGGGAWSISDVNAAEFGVKVTA